MERKQDLTILCFFMIVLAVIYLSISFERDEEAFRNAMKSISRKDVITVFSEANLYALKRGKPLFSLAGSSATHDSSTKTFTVDNPVGVLERGLRPIYYRALKGIFNLDTEWARLTERVFLEGESTTIQAQSVDIDMARKNALARGFVETKTTIQKNGDSFFVHSDFANYQSKESILTYKGKVDGSIKRKRVYEESVFFKTDELILNKEKSEANLLGNVYLKKGGVEARSNEGIIFLENYDKKIKYYALSENVRILENVQLKDSSIMERKAFADRLEGIVAEEKIILTGNPRVMQGSDRIRGNTILIREKNEIVEVDDATSVLTINKIKK